MAEPFGIAVGAVSVTHVFIACLDCFDYLQLGRHFGRDLQTSLLALECAKLRLTRWGEAVNVKDDPKLGRPDATASDIQIARKAFHQILVLFAETENLKEVRRRAMPKKSFRHLYPMTSPMAWSLLSRGLGTR